MLSCVLRVVGGVEGGVCVHVNMCVCARVFAYRKKQNKLSVFGLRGGELSIVTGAESVLLLPHLKGNAFDKEEEKKEEEEGQKKQRRVHETASLLQPHRLSAEGSFMETWNVRESLISCSCLTRTPNFTSSTHLLSLSLFLSSLSFSLSLNAHLTNLDTHRGELEKAKKERGRESREKQREITIPPFPSSLGRRKAT